MCHDGLTVRDGSAVVPKYRFVPPSQMLAVRSNWRPAVTEKSAASTTFAHGAEQPAGGVKLNSLGVKSAKVRPANSGTTHGVVAGGPPVGARRARQRTRDAPPATTNASERGRDSRDRTRHLRVARTVVLAIRGGQRALSLVTGAIAAQ